MQEFRAILAKGESNDQPKQQIYQQRNSQQRNPQQLVKHQSYQAKNNPFLQGSTQWNPRNLIGSQNRNQVQHQPNQWSQRGQKSFEDIIKQPAMSTPNTRQYVPYQAPNTRQYVPYSDANTRQYVPYSDANTGQYVSQQIHKNVVDERNKLKKEIQEYENYLKTFHIQVKEAMGSHAEMQTMLMNKFKEYQRIHKHLSELQLGYFYYPNTPENRDDMIEKYNVFDDLYELQGECQVIILLHTIVEFDGESDTADKSYQVQNDINIKRIKQFKEYIKNQKGWKTLSDRQLYFTDNLSNRTIPFGLQDLVVNQILVNVQALTHTKQKQVCYLIILPFQEPLCIFDDESSKSRDSCSTMQKYVQNLKRLNVGAGALMNLLIGKMIREHPEQLHRRVVCSYNANKKSWVSEEIQQPQKYMDEVIKQIELFKDVSDVRRDPIDIAHQLLFDKFKNPAKIKDIEFMDVLGQYPPDYITKSFRKNELNIVIDSFRLSEFGQLNILNYQAPIPSKENLKDNPFKAFKQHFENLASLLNSEQSAMKSNVANPRTGEAIFFKGKYVSDPLIAAMDFEKCSETKQKFQVIGCLPYSHQISNTVVKRDDSTAKTSGPSSEANEITKSNMGILLDQIYQITEFERRPGFNKVQDLNMVRLLNMALSTNESIKEESQEQHVEQLSQYLNDSKTVYRSIQNVLDAAAKMSGKRCSPNDKGIGTEFFPVSEMKDVTEDTRGKINQRCGTAGTEQDDSIYFGKTALAALIDNLDSTYLQDLNIVHGEDIKLNYAKVADTLKNSIRTFISPEQIHNWKENKKCFLHAVKQYIESSDDQKQEGQQYVNVIDKSYIDEMVDTTSIHSTNSINTISSIDSSLNGARSVFSHHTMLGGSKLKNRGKRGGRGIDIREIVKQNKQNKQRNTKDVDLNSSTISLIDQLVNGDHDTASEYTRLADFPLRVIKEENHEESDTQKDLNNTFEVGLVNSGGIQTSSLTGEEKKGEEKKGEEKKGEEKKGEEKKGEEKKGEEKKDSNVTLDSQYMEGGMSDGKKEAQVVGEEKKEAQVAEEEKKEDAQAPATHAPATHAPAAQELEGGVSDDKKDKKRKKDKKEKKDKKQKKQGGEKSDSDGGEK